MRSHWTLYTEFYTLLTSNYNNTGTATFNFPWVLALKMKGITKTSEVLN
jgi:hypothetical protein